jgi:hypothetical protein
LGLEMVGFSYDEAGNAESARIVFERAAGEAPDSLSANFNKLSARLENPARSAAAASVTKESSSA